MQMRDFAVCSRSLAKLQRTSSMSARSARVTRLVTRTPTSNRDNEHPFAGGLRAAGYSLDVEAHAYARRHFRLLVHISVTRAEEMAGTILIYQRLLRLYC